MPQANDWALNRCEAAFRRMVVFMQTQTGKKAGWAFGQVSLWGRVIEHEKGWRGQHAYPYALTVHSRDPAVAEAIRDEYTVDAEWAGAELVEKVQRRVAAKKEAQEQKKQASDAELRRKIRKLQGELVDLSAEIDAEFPETVPQKPKPVVVRIRPLGPTYECDGSEEEALRAFYLHAAERFCELDDDYWKRHRWGHSSLSDLGQVLRVQAFKDHETWRVNNRPLVQRLRRMKREGLVENGAEWRGSSTAVWSLTAAGLERLAGMPRESAAYFRRVRRNKSGYMTSEKRVRVEWTDAELMAAMQERAPFVHELEALWPAEMVERQHARANGTLRAYLEQARAGDRWGNVHLHWEPEEVLAALQRAVTRAGVDPVPFADLMDELAPGQPSDGETPRISYVLVDLRRAGLVRMPERMKWGVMRETGFPPGNGAD